MDNKLKQAFGRNLKQIRKSKDITQEVLAEMIGIHPRQVSKIETGEHFPNSSTLENLCFALSVSPKDLFNFELTTVTEETGTGERYTYKAVVEGNVVYLDNKNFRKQKVEKITCSNDIDVKMLNLARKTGKPITVQYFNDNETYKVIEYYPDGTYKIVKDNKEKENDLLADEIKSKIKNEGMENYFRLALDALSSNDALEKLEFMLSGLKMGRK